MAPDVEQSSASHAITASKPLTYRRTRIIEGVAYRVNGTPADCVALGSYHWEKVDVVLSGLEPHIKRVLELLLPRTELKLVNVNLPPGPRGMCWTRQAVEQYDGRVMPGEDPLGRRHFWFTVVPLERHQPGTDLWADQHGYISITPLRRDLTDEDALRRAADDEATIEF